MNILKSLLVNKYLLQLIIDPTKTKNIFNTVELLSDEHDHPLYIRVEKELKSNKVFKQMYETSYYPTSPTLQKLRHYSPGTLGHAYYRHLVDNNLDPDLFPHLKPKDFLMYATGRIYAEHDLHHALLGKDTSIPGELYIQAFSFGQFSSGVSLLLISGGLISLLRKQPELAPKAFEDIVKGYEQGKKSPLLLSLRLFEKLDQPLEDVKKLAKLSSVTKAKKIGKKVKLEKARASVQQV